MLRSILGGILALSLLTSPLLADEPRVSPDDLRLRTAVSRLLSPSLRLQLRDLAAGTPLPREGGVVQTEEILDRSFADRPWDGDRKALVRYYFMIARMEKSQDFSAEFERRRKLTEEGRTLMRTYTEQLNRAIARGVFVANVPVQTGPLIEFPLRRVGWEAGADGTKTLQVLHRYPEVDTDLGRETLRALRDQAGSDLERLEGQLSDLDDAERTFLEEIHLVGTQVVELRPRIAKLVRIPRAGLPFSF